MRTITLLQNRQKGWYIHTTSGGDTVSTNEQYGKPSQASSAMRAFLQEGRHQPYARMVVVVDGKKVVIRASRPTPATDVAFDMQRAKVREIIRARKTH